VSAEDAARRAVEATLRELALRNERRQRWHAD
jgi:hypothetical protein